MANQDLSATSAFLNSDVDHIEKAISILERKIKIQEEKVSPKTAVLLSLLDEVRSKIKNFENNLKMLTDQEERKYWTKYVTRYFPILLNNSILLANFNPFFL